MLATQPLARAATVVYEVSGNLTRVMLPAGHPFGLSAIDVGKAVTGSFTWSTDQEEVFPGIHFGTFDLEVDGQTFSHMELRPDGNISNNESLAEFASPVDRLRYDYFGPSTINDSSLIGAAAYSVELIDLDATVFDASARTFTIDEFLAVDLSQFEIMRWHFSNSDVISENDFGLGEVVASGEILSISVPEPAGTALLALSIAMLVRRRRS